VLLRTPEQQKPLDAPSPILFLPLLAVMVFSFGVNALFDEWNYRGYDAALIMPGGLRELFGGSQFGGWYRPLGVLSLWVDSRVFHEHVWGYHLQSIVLHAINAWLVYRIALRLGIEKRVAQWSGVLFALAAVAYEPMMWPSARFDLIAMMFAGLALLAGMTFLDGDGSRWLWVSLGFYLLGVLSKESVYAFPFLFGLAAIGRLRANSQRTIAAGIGVVFVTVAMLGVRLAALHGIGGYGNAGAASTHLSFSIATVKLMLTKVMPTSVVTMNQYYPMPGIVLAAVAAFAGLLAVAAVAGASTTVAQKKLVFFALAGAIPVATIVSWLDPSAQHVRYLYMSAAFTMMLIAGALANSRWPVAMLSAFALLNVFFAGYNMLVYKTTYQHSDGLAVQIAADYKTLPEVRQVKVVGMPDEYNGVLFSKFQLEYRLQEIAPDIALDRTPDDNCENRLCYRWRPEERALIRVPGK